jgi:hypothetical protein
MKKALRKFLSVKCRDLWDGPNEYLFSGLSVDKLKYMLNHKANKDLRIKKAIEEELSFKMRNHTGFFCSKKILINMKKR